MKTRKRKKNEKKILNKKYHIVFLFQDLKLFCFVALSKFEYYRHKLSKGKFWCKLSKFAPCVLDSILFRFTIVVDVSHSCRKKSALKYG